MLGILSTVSLLTALIVSGVLDLNRPTPLDSLVLALFVVNMAVRVIALARKAAK